MREGICKLLAVSTQKEQLLCAVKNLMVCNARIRAYRAELQGQKEPSLDRTEEQWVTAQIQREQDEAGIYLHEFLAVYLGTWI